VQWLDMLLVEGLGCGGKGGLGSLESEATWVNARDHKIANQLLLDTVGNRLFIH
jgi:hypothetical protein